MSDSKSGSNPKNPSGPSVLFEDPFGMKTLEIQQAQNSNEELDLDDGFVHDETEDGEAEAEIGASSESDDDSEATLAALARVMEAQVAKDIAAAEALVDDAIEAGNAESPEEALARNAAQIAEDQALQAAEAAEAEQQAAELDPELLAALPSRDVAEIESCIESLLFMSDKPMSLKKLKDYLGPDFEDELFQEALKNMQTRYDSPRFGIEVVEIGGGYQFRTKPARAALAKKLAKTQIQRLSSGAMESLAIIAYKQPCMKEDIDKVRGVDSSYFIRMLLDRKLIEISGRSELPGRPSLFTTTPHFLELFGLADLAAMPPLRELEAMIPQSQSANPEDDTPQVKEMRRMVSQMKSDRSTTLFYDPKEDEKILSEIRERVKSIPTTTPSLTEAKEREKAAAELAKLDPSEAPAGPDGQIDLVSAVEPIAPEIIASEVDDAPGAEAGLGPDS